MAGQAGSSSSKAAVSTSSAPGGSKAGGTSRRDARSDTSRLGKRRKDDTVDTHTTFSVMLNL